MRRFARFQLDANPSVKVSLRHRSVGDLDGPRTFGSFILGTDDERRLRRALLDGSGAARCSYCHDRVSGSEPDLVACSACATVLHEERWSELGRCPVLGCAGSELERAARSVR